MRTALLVLVAVVLGCGPDPAQVEKQRVLRALESLKSGMTEAEVVNLIGRPMRTEFPPFIGEAGPVESGCLSCRQELVSDPLKPVRRVFYEFRFPEKKGSAPIEKLTIYYDEGLTIVEVERGMGLEFSSVWF
jgi:hypothetical protein